MFMPPRNLDARNLARKFFGEQGVEAYFSGRPVVCPRLTIDIRPILSRRYT